MNLLHHDFARYYGSGSVLGNEKRVTIEIPRHPDDTRYVLTLNPVRLPEGAKELVIAGEMVIPKGCEIVARGTTPGGMRPHFRPILLRNWTDEYARWWHCLSVTIEPGDFVMRVDLTKPGSWSSVFGKKGDSSDAAREQFHKATARPVRIGITFGGRDHFGHGVFATRAGARVILEKVGVV